MDWLSFYPKTKAADAAFVFIINNYPSMDLHQAFNG